jgi:hypothetical protein
MPSPTGVTKLVRKKKKTLQGQRRKRANRQKGTVNFMNAFPGEKKAASK